MQKKRYHTPARLARLLADLVPLTNKQIVGLCDVGILRYYRNPTTDKSHYHVDVESFINYLVRDQHLPANTLAEVHRRLAAM